MKNTSWKKLFRQFIVVLGFIALFVVLLKGNNPSPQEPLILKSSENSNRIHVSPFAIGSRDPEPRDHSLEVFTLKSDGYLLIIRNTQGG